MIPLFKPLYPNKKAILKSIEECLDKGWTGSGYKTLEFERAWKEYTGAKYAHFLNSATAGLHLALHLARRKKTTGLKVLVTPLTFVSTVHVIRYEGLIPVFVDIDNSLNIDLDILEEKILRLGADNIAACIFVGMGGNPTNLRGVKNLCKKANIPLILDAAHMAGSKIGESYIGCASDEIDYTVFSFQSVKNLPTADSGMVCCRYEHDDCLARQLSWLGIDRDTWSRENLENPTWKYEIENIGWKYHGNSIMAAIAIEQLKVLDVSNKIREQIANQYDLGLNQELGRIRIELDVISSRYLYQVILPKYIDRDSIIKSIARKGVQLGVHYPIITSFKAYSHYEDILPKAREFNNRLISLPMGPHLREEHVHRVIEVINREMETYFD